MVEAPQAAIHSVVTLVDSAVDRSPTQVETSLVLAVIPQLVTQRVAMADPLDMVAAHIPVPLATAMEETCLTAMAGLLTVMETMAAVVTAVTAALAVFLDLVRTCSLSRDNETLSDVLYSPSPSTQSQWRR